MLAPDLENQLAGLWTDDTTCVPLISLMVHLRQASALQRALELASASGGELACRERMLQLLGEAGVWQYAKPLLNLVGGAEPVRIQLAALSTLQRFEDQDVADCLMCTYLQVTGPVRARITDVLLSRKSWARIFLGEIDAGKFSEKEISVEQLRQISLHRDRRLNDLVRKHWGTIAGGTAEEKLAEMRRLSNDLRAGTGNPVAGKQVFAKHCAVCHRLFDEGNLVGPELTHANRKDRDYLLASIVDPNAVIRKEYLSYVVQTRDGRLLTGLIADQSPSSITLLDAKNERTIIPRNKVESIQESAVSLMPENLLKELKPNEVRDLFDYLQSDAPSVVNK